MRYVNKKTRLVDVDTSAWYVSSDGLPFQFIKDKTEGWLRGFIRVSGGEGNLRAHAKDLGGNSLWLTVRRESDSFVLNGITTLNVKKYKEKIQSETNTLLNRVNYLNTLAAKLSEPTE